MKLLQCLGILFIAVVLLIIIILVCFSPTEIENGLIIVYAKDGITEIARYEGKIKLYTHNYKEIVFSINGEKHQFLNVCAEIVRRSVPDQ